MWNCNIKISAMSVFLMFEHTVPDSQYVANISLSWKLQWYWNKF